MQKAFYPVFTSLQNGKKLAFYPVKKNANTSSKLFFASHLGIEDKFFFIEDEIPRFKQTVKMHESFKKKSNLVNLYEGKYAFQIINVDYKSCIVREPLERFISAYKNRVLFHKDKNFYKHSVSEVIEKLENGNVENKHFLPQSFFLGNDLSYFDIVVIFLVKKKFFQNFKWGEKNMNLC